MIIKCDYCGKKLFETNEKNRGAIASDAMRRGWVAKMPIFFGIPEFKIFCRKECKDKWFDKNIPKEKIQEGRKVCEELSDKFHSEEFQKTFIKGITKNSTNLQKS